MLKEVSSRLKEYNIFHKIENGFLVTRKTRVKIPPISSKVSYLTGVLTGDGNLTMVKRMKGGFHYTVKITSNSTDYLNYLNTRFRELFSIKGEIGKDNRKMNTFFLIFRNVCIFWYFVTVGLCIGRKINPSIPHKIRTNRKFLITYLSGLVDTDGHINRNRIQLKQKSKSFLEEIKQALKLFKLSPTEVKVNYTKSMPYYYIRFDNRLFCYKVATVAQ
ncbi:MAG: hypothetical protein HYW24_01385 [Candidatus Aenigmarchaeota archaeon]|nr:hypothetical protein [Candidatus Aenigmarchaeota archaeon]